MPFPSFLQPWSQRAARFALVLLVAILILSIIDPKFTDFFHGLPQKAEKPPAANPLVLDRDGDGIELMPIRSVFFDIDSDGIHEGLGWAAPDDAFLARDLNGNGTIDNPLELYSSSTQTGFDALSLEDMNRDGLVDAQDAGWSRMRVWQDANSNGITDAGELLTMEQANVKSISLAHQNVRVSRDGNAIQETSSYTATSGASHDVAAVLFATDFYRTQVIIPEGFEYPKEVLLLPDLNGTGKVADLSYIMALDPKLATAAKALVHAAATMSAAEFRAGFEAFLMSWAGTEGIDPTSRDRHVNARHMAFAEKVRGVSYTFAGGANPTSTTEGDTIERFYHTLVDSFIVRFAAQIGPSTTFMAENPEDGLSHPFWAFSTLLYDRKTDILRGKIGSTVTAIVKKAPAGLAGKVAHFERMMPLVRALLSEFASAKPEDVRAALSVLEDKALAEFAFHAVTKGIHVGTAGNDTLIGNGDTHNIYVYAAGSGDDTVIGAERSAARSQLLLIGLKPSDVTVRCNVPTAGDFKLVFASGGSMSLKGFAKNQAVDKVLFGDGSAWTQIEVLTAGRTASAGCR